MDSRNDEARAVATGGHQEAKHKSDADKLPHLAYPRKRITRKAVAAELQFLLAAKGSR